MITRPPDQNVRDCAQTDDQHNLLLEAGAGSGKTRTLLDRLTWLLEKKVVDLSRIVAITFTEKAAEELKERLRKCCGERINDATTDEERLKWRQHLRKVDTSYIGTIHGFCARLLRAHALRLGLDPLFEVLDANYSTMLLGETMQTFVLEGLRAGCDDLVCLTTAFGFDGIVRALTDAVAQRSKFTVEQLPNTAKEVLAAWEEMRGEGEETLVQELRENAEVRTAAQTLQSIQPLDPADKLAVLRAKVLTLLTEALDAETARTEALAAWRTIGTLTKAGNIGSKKGWRGDDKTQILEAIRRLQEVAKEATDLAPSDPGIVLNAAELTAAFNRILPQALNAYTTAKRHHASLDFDDLLLLTRALLRDYPDLRHEEQERFRYILVDEFQDTDPVQRDIIWYLVQDGSTSPAVENRLCPGKLFVVGDAKQSIYRFRGADVTVYNETRDTFSAEDHPECTVLSLCANFRSQRRLVAFFNDFFSRPEVMGEPYPARPPFEASYECLKATRSAPPDGADVTFLLVVGEESSINELRERSAAQIARFISESVRTNPLTVATRTDHGEVWGAARWSSFMVLLPTMTSVHIYERALREYDIPYYVVSGRGFYNRSEILDVLAVLKILDKPHDEISLARVLRSPFCGVSDEGLYWLARESGLAEGLANMRLDHLGEEDRQRVQEAAGLLQNLREACHHLPLADLVERILDETGLAAIVAARFDGSRAYANLRKLVDIARNFETTASPTLGRFIDHIETLRTQEFHEGEAPAEGEEGDTVVLMTIHKAKGLQRPIVVVADLWRGREPHNPTPVVFHPQVGPILKGPGTDGLPIFPPVGQIAIAEERAREEAERRRLLYVAFTRAQDRLVVSTPLVFTKNENSLKGGLHVETLFSVFGEAWLTKDGITGEYATEKWLGKIIRESPPPLSSSPPKVSQPEPEHGKATQAILQRIGPCEPDLSAISHFTVTELGVYVICPYQYRLRFVEQRAAFRPPVSDIQPGRLNALERGTVVHRALERLGRGPASELFAQVEAAMRECGVAAHVPEEIERIVADLLRFTDSPTWERIRTAAELRTEVPVVALLEGGIIEGLIDALLRGPQDELHLIDYKTGRRQDAGTVEQHRFQVGAYAAALERVTGHLPATILIHYFDSNHSESVPPREGADSAVAMAEKAIAGIRAGHFPPYPTSACDQCPYAWVCLPAPRALRSPASRERPPATLR
ncbi:MAG: UvrD-helicase domain-containing protein [Candidatus Zipacnadales bacterium]